MLWALLVAILIGVDQWTKWFFLTNQAQFHKVEVIKDFFYLTYLENRGAAFGILQNFRWGFIIMTLIAVGAMIWYFVKNRHWVLRTSLALLIAGAIGNLIDRVLRGFVVDFLDFYPLGYDFPIFNVADICVTCGVIVLIIYLLFIYKEPEKEVTSSHG
jgi:signal peptidase II